MQDIAFYNEIDKDAAAWLRELIAEGHIAPGIVDERSIEDVRPDELAGFTQCHFFAGIGIWSLALRAAGVPDDYPVWTGSCPCQPFSSAGKGDGFDDERHLWPAFYHLISQRRPAAVLGEQVASKDAEPWLDALQVDLEALDYAVASVAFPSAGIGAPHIRDRLYWVALGDPCSTGLQGHAGHDGAAGRPGQIGPITAPSVFGRMADLPGSGRREERADAGGGAIGNGSQGFAAGFVHGSSADRMADTGSADHRGEIRAPGYVQPQVNRPADQSGGCGNTPGSVGDSDGNGTGRDGRSVCGTLTGDDRQHGTRDAGASSGDGRLAHADSKIESGRGVFGPGQSDGAGAGQPRERLAGLRTDGELGSAPRPGPVNGFWADADWLHCRDGKWRPVEPGTQPLAHGMPRSMGDLSPELQRLATVAGLSKASLKRAKQFRVGGLRAYGNAINARAAQAFIESIMETA